MSQNKLPPGSFCWVDVAVSDPKVTHKFFADLFGWGRKLRPTKDADVYSIMTLDGKHVAGICGVDGTGPSQWMSYLLVDDLKTAGQEVTRLGGQLIEENIDIPSFGLMTVAQDPTGAIFALWQSYRGEGPGYMGPGSVCWIDLFSCDIPKALDFYGALNGWTHRKIKLRGEDYFIFSLGTNDVAGLGPSPHRDYSYWMVNFSVDDCKATTQSCHDLGGKILQPPYQLEGLGTVAHLADPTGGLFGVLEGELNFKQFGVQP